MRLWSLDPSYLDAKGMVALWREGLLARKVLEGKTRGYTNHPQLLRFKAAIDPNAAIDAYLEGVVHEATRRGYSFDSTKIRMGQKAPSIPVTEGQLRYELEHLKRKLLARDPERLKALPIGSIATHPLFTTIPGPVEDWERTLETE
jgi:hypothetical protein